MEEAEEELARSQLTAVEAEVVEYHPNFLEQLFWLKVQPLRWLRPLVLFYLKIRLATCKIDVPKPIKTFLLFLFQLFHTSLAMSTKKQHVTNTCLSASSRAALSLSAASKASRSLATVLNTRHRGTYKSWITVCVRFLSRARPQTSIWVCLWKIHLSRQNSNPLC